MTGTSRIRPGDVARAVAELPPLPESIADVIAACDDQDMTVGELSQIILRDQSLTANILKLANSAFYGHARAITTVTEAVVLLGFSTIKSLAISSHTARLLDRSLPGYGLCRGELWRHSVSVGFTSRRLAVELKLAPVEEAFVAGLLHDIGKVVLACHLADAFEDVARAAERERRPFHEAERELLGFDHADLGARVASSWSFPPQLVEAIQHHHAPGLARRKPLLAHVVHLADAAYGMLGGGPRLDGRVHRIERETLRALGFDAHRLTLLIDEMQPLVAAGDAGLV